MQIGSFVGEKSSGFWYLEHLKHEFCQGLTQSEGDKGCIYTMEFRSTSQDFTWAASSLGCNTGVCQSSWKGTLQPGPCRGDTGCVEGGRAYSCCAVQMSQKRALCQLWFHTDRLQTDVTGKLTFLNSVWMGKEGLLHL